MRHLMPLFLLLAACANAGLPASDAQLATPPVIQSCDKCLVVFGDSIGVGIGTTDETTKGYAYLVGANDNLPVFNVAHGGTKAADALVMIQNFRLTSGSKVVWLSGYNDMRANGLNQALLYQYETTMVRAFQILDASGVETYVGGCLTMLPQSYGIGSIGQNQGSDAAAQAYADALVSAAQGFSHIHIVNTHSLFTPSQVNMNEDLQHPNDLGAQELATLFEGVGA